MRIIADESIPYVEEAFSTLGDVTLLPGRGMQASDVQDADILLVRSVTPVGPGLLEGSRIRFVGSPTIGFDHIDRDYLKAQGIGFSSAPGCNATSAAEYVISALLTLAERKNFSLAGKTAGIIGCGNVGSRVLKKLTALGVECLINDPLLKAQGGHGDFVGLDTLLAADIITLHVPLTNTGKHPTFHLVDEALMRRFRPGTVLVNTSRGAVVDNQGLEHLLDEGADLQVVLDVWEGEPAINTRLLEKVELGTPHIAGYSWDGKLRGTGMIYHAVCHYLDLPSEWTAADVLPARQPINLNGAGDDIAQEISKAVFHSYDVRQDDVRLREILSLPPEEQPGYFDQLRGDYPVRREFLQSPVVLNRHNPRLEQMLAGIGFNIP
jgi:erythronate-4-phosphate dehydrogenase